ncbi:MAG: M60 family peptidase N-terminal accessory domain-containing protein, partial [Phycisphaerales bacterium]
MTRLLHLRALTFALVSALPLAAHAAPAPADAPALGGLKAVVAPGTPGELAVWGPNARVLVAGVDDQLLTPVAACGSLGEKGGRAVAFAHTGFLEQSSMTVLDTGALIDRAVRWSARATPEAEPGPRVALINCGLTEFALEKGWRATKVEARELPTALKRGDFDTVCIVGNALNPGQRAALDAFLLAGGGIVAAQTAWAWNVPAGKTIQDNPLNQVFAPVGLAWTQGYSGKTGEQGFLVQEATDPLLHASAALDALLAAPPNAKPTAPLLLAANTTTTCARALPMTDTLLRPRMVQLVREHEGELVPTAKRPLTDKQPLQRTLLTVQLAEMNALPPAQVKAHPSAAAFPGSVPADAPRVERTVTINTKVPEWHSTGLYAAPGETVEVRVPAAARGRSLEVRIGCHKDGIWKHGKWERVPEITRTWPIKDERTPVASPFGGQIYIDVPRSAPGETTEVTIAGAVEAPLFVLGKTTVQEWQETIRKHPAPWAELGTAKVFVSVPSSTIRTLDDPEALLKVWDRVLDAAADLATIPHERARPERYVADQQI